MNKKLIGKCLTAVTTFTMLTCSFAFANFDTLNSVHFTGKDTPYRSNNFKLTSLDNGIPTEVRIKKDGTGFLQMTVSQNKQRVYETYLTKTGNLMTLQRVQDEASGRIFYVMNGIRYGAVYGYDPINKQWQEYINAKNYYSGYDQPNVTLRVKPEGEMELSFFVFGNPSGVPNHIYHLSWNNDTNRFDYKDLGYYKFYDGQNHKSAVYNFLNK